jgi:lipoate-protein ligase A
MAIDYFLANSCHKNMIPVIRFYGWDPNCLSIGYHQNAQLINQKRLMESGFGFVRRPTGGRAILHAQELTYSIHVPKKLISHQELYLFVHRIFAAAFGQLGINVNLEYNKAGLNKITNKADDLPCFTKSAWSEIQYKGKKLIGSAQKIYPHSILQHGSILTGKAHKYLTRYLSINIIEKHLLKKELERKTICLDEILSHPPDNNQLIAAIINQLELMTNIYVNCQNLSNYELFSARKYQKLFAELK